MKNYLEKDNSSGKIIQGNKYFDGKITYSTDLVRDYHRILTESVDIFSDITNDFFELEQPISNFLRVFRNEFYKVSRNVDFQKTIPKLRIKYEDDNSTVIYWNSQLFRIYFSFEDKEEENSYGIVENNVEDGSFFTKNGLLKETNYKILINEFIEYVLKNT